MAKTLVLALAAPLAAVLPLGRSAAADAEAASIDMILQTAFVQDVEGFCMAPVPFCFSVCEGGVWKQTCEPAACAFDCIWLSDYVPCGANWYQPCDCA